MKRLLLAFFDPPWWFLILGWPVLVIACIYYAWPSNMENFVEAAASPEMKLAVVREVKGAERRVALEFASATLKRVARMVPAKDARTDIDKALAEIHSKIEEGYQPPKSAEKSAAENKAGNLDKSENTEKSDKAPEDNSRAGRRAARRAERLARDRARDREGYGIDVNDKGEVHTNLGLIDDDLASDLEKKYGSGPLPVLDMSYKQRIYAEVQDRMHHALTGLLLICLLIVSWPFFVASKIVVSILRLFSSRATQAKKVAEQNSLERQLSEARLAAMQAQIEPHFLFNTMASVQQLIETDPPAAAKMQANLIKYLRGAVPQMRESSSTLGREFDLSSAYLDILKIRMEDRLSYRIDLPPALAAVAFPPMMLPTLVENAIKHGLEPLTEGGEITIAAAQANGKLRVSVADTGMGFANQPGRGVGLTNIRERLVALYGKQAQLIVEANQPRGARLTIEIPYSGART